MANVCAVHAGASATFTCSRCGSFACEGCSSSVVSLCAACDRMRGAVLGADVSAGGLIGDSFRLVAQFGAAVAAFAGVEAVSSTGLELVREALPKGLGYVLVMGLIGVAISSIIQGAWISLLSSAAHATPIGIGEALSRGAVVALPLFGCNLFLGLGVVFGLVLLVVPGIVLALGWCMAAPAVVVARMGPFEALGDSWSATQGHRLNLLVAFIGTGMVAAVVAFGAGAVGNAVVARLPGGALVVGLATSVITSIAGAPAITVPVLAYLRVKRSFVAD